MGKQRWLRIAMAGLALAALVAAGLAVSRMGGSPSVNATDRPALEDTSLDASSPNDVDLPIGVVEPGTPCNGAKGVARSVLANRDSLSRLVSSLTSASVFLPAADSEVQISDGWICPNGFPVLLYEGIQLTFEGGWRDVDVMTKFGDLAQQGGGAVESVAGVTTLIQTPAKSGYNVLMAVRGDTMVQLISPADVAPQDLRSLATSSLEARPTSAQ